MARILALDYGTIRTGIAITDEMQLIASGLTTVLTKDLLPFLKTYFTEEKVETVVLGEPKQMSGIPSESENQILKFLDKFQKQFPNINVERQDERFTSKLAVQSMITSGVKKKQRQNKALVDEISATIILQSFLEKNN
ncbi:MULTISPECIES: Holliday junction resolvase RuvX [Croceitalea]|uniref:Putative pre-16S rRNA nuclease n=1 Tax=Croceitalea vernalis TaxID=3075599 RepID=A0ABU3BIX9_9FLAO|nr:MULTISPECIES: Holliday junction resolvase RuvX [unclassified Croceitalea]MDT0540294.1 Holliday junction resolvase RuvX [Croceitalea sp. P059]MDT0622129.1 Holliday junction resolvase RuvX [Croceitalea sp. P007]